MDNPRRLFIESDYLTDHELDSVRMMVRWQLEDSGKKFIPDIFDEVVDYAYVESEKALKSVLRCDEIYASSSLYGLSGAYAYAGSPAVLDRLIRVAKDRVITGKSVFFLTKLNDILWDNVHKPTFRYVFQFRNKFYTTDGVDGLFKQMDPKAYFKSFKNG